MGGHLTHTSIEGESLLDTMMTIRNNIDINHNRGKIWKQA